MINTSFKYKEYFHFGLKTVNTSSTIQWTYIGCYAFAEAKLLIM